MIARLGLLLLLLALPGAAQADPVTLVATALTAAFGAGTASLIIATIASYGTYILVAANYIYGGMDARRRARNQAGDARRAYNAGLQERTVSALQADPPWRVVYGACRTGGDIVAIFTTDKTGTRTDGSSYTKADALKHLVVVVAAHEVDDITEMYIDGVAVGALDANRWATVGDLAKPITITQERSIAPGAAVTFPGTVTVLSVDDANGSMNEGGWNGATPSYTAVGATVTNTSGSISLAVRLTYVSSPGSVRWGKALGTTDQAVDSYLSGLAPAQWTATDRLRGLAYVVVTLDLEDARFQGGPPQMAWDVRGRKLFDPRTSTTAWSANPALCVRDYLLAPWGFEVGSGDIDDTYTIAAANACDASISLTSVNAAGTTTTATGPTYTCNGALMSSDSRERTLNDLCDSMGGYAVYGARWQIVAGAWTAPVMALTDDDLAGQIEVVQAGVSLDEVFNGVRGGYIASDSGVTSDFTYANATFVAADGRALWTEISLPYTNSAARARNLARVMVEANRDSQVIRFPASLRAWPLQVGDRVTVTSAEYGFTAKAYRVTDWAFGLQTPVMLTLQEDAADIYDLADAAASDPSPNTALPNPWQVAAVTGLGAASGDAHLVIRPDGSLNIRIRVVWAAITSAYVADGSGRVEVRWRSPRARAVGGTVYPGDAADAWRTVTAPGDAVQAYIDGALPGDQVIVSVVVVNGMGARSSPAYLAHLVVGRTLPPAAVSGLAASLIPGGVNVTWAASTDAGYAATELRVGGASWDSAAILYRGAARPWVWPWPAAGSYTLRARHFESGGLKSTTDATLSVTVDASALVQWTGVTGTGRPADNATVGATWGTNVGSRPGNLAAMTGSENLGLNLVSAANWVIGSSGSQTGAGGTQWYWTSTSAGGSETVEYLAGPDGAMRPVYFAISGSAAGTSGEGGISSTSSIAIDNTKPYRFACWIYVTGPADGSIYLGIGGNQVDNIPAGTLNANPYFHAFPRSDLTVNRWYLFTGHVLPVGYSGGQLNMSYVYDGTTGQKIRAGVDFRWSAGITSCTLRTFQYYTGGAGRYALFTGPRFDQIDGSEPSIAALLTDAVLARANTAFTNANTAQTTSDAGLALRLRNDARNVLAGPGGLATGSLTWDSSGNRTGGYGVGMTATGLAAYNATFGATPAFVIDGSTGSISIKGGLDAASGTLGVVTVATSGHVKGGQTDYATGTGFYLGYSGAAYKFSIGSATQYLRWTGSALEIKIAAITPSLTSLSQQTYAISTTTVRTVGTITATGSTGTAPYTYAWALGGVVVDAATFDARNSGWLTSSTNTCTIFARGAGNCLVTVDLTCVITDANGFSITARTSATAWFGTGPP